MLAALQDEKPSSTFAGLDVCLTPAQADIICGQQSQSKEDSAAAEKRLRVAGILRLPSAVDKKKSEKKKARATNAIGESHSAPKALNVPERTELLQQHAKRKADELLAAQEKKKKKMDDEEPVAYVFFRLGYIPTRTSNITISTLQSFMRANKLVLKKESTRPNRARLLAFVKASITESRTWVQSPKKD